MYNPNRYLNVSEKGREFMNLLDQWLISITFQAKKATIWRNQSIWKTIFYLFSLLGLCFALTVFFSTRQSEPISPTIKETQLHVANGKLVTAKSDVILLSQINSLIVIGSDQSFENLRYENILLLEEDTWSYGRKGYPLQSNRYSEAPFVKNGEFTYDQALKRATVLDRQLKWFAPIYLYVAFMLQLFVHIVLISLLALAGRSFKRMHDITYRQAWTLTAYGVTLPILIKTLLDLFGFQIGFMSLLYWASIATFALLAIRSIDNET